MSGLRDRLLRMRAAQTAQAERLAGMVEREESDEVGESTHGDANGADEAAARSRVEGRGMQAATVTEESDALTRIEADAETGAEAEAFVAERSADAGNDESLGTAWSRLGVRVVSSQEGDFLVRERRYAMDYRHGVHALDELLEALPALAAFDKHPRNDGDYANLLFLDLETTGLGVGAGNVPFMIGLAYMQENEFVVEQMLIRHHAEERAMIAYLCGLLPSFTHLVTYNGRTFDWPVLYNRFIMNGFREFQWEPQHIDLLHPSRAVWRNTLTSCKLSHVEEERLGITRDDDVPGSMAPAIYFQYLADGDPGPLLGVFKHNEIDMLSLAALAIRFGHFLGGRVGSALPVPEESEELLRTGLWLERMGKPELSEPLYALFAEHRGASAKCLCLLAERDKKCGNWQRAVLLWQKAVQATQESPWPEYEAHIELAMYYEHKTKELEQALLLAEAAFELAGRRRAGVRTVSKHRSELERIRKRIDRLRLKRSKG